MSHSRILLNTKTTSGYSASYNDDEDEDEFDDDADELDDDD